MQSILRETTISCTFIERFVVLFAKKRWVVDLSERAQIEVRGSKW